MPNKITIEYLRKAGLMNEKGLVVNWRKIENANEIVGQLYNQLPFVPFDRPLQELIYILQNNLTEIPKCKNCGKTLNYDRKAAKYNNNCSYQCREPSKEINRRSTMKAKYGTEHMEHVPEFVAKRKATLMRNHGVTHNYQLQHKYKEKRRVTILKRYGFNYWAELCRHMRECFYAVYGTNDIRKVARKKAQTDANWDLPDILK